MVCNNYNYNIRFGYVYSVTFEGRILSAILIIVGLIAVLGFVPSFGKTLLDDRLNKKVIADDIQKSIKDRIDILEQLLRPAV